MVYKINNLNDLENIKDIDDEAKAVLTYYTEMLCALWILAFHFDSN